MQITAPSHIEMVEQLAALQAAVSFTTEFVLGRSPTEAFHLEVGDELVIEFWK
jgi:hypothetical protein